MSCGEPLEPRNDALTLRQTLVAVREGLRDPKFRRELALLLSEVVRVRPVEPLYPVDLAARLIPMTLPRLRKILSVHGFPKRYRLVTRMRRRHRLLTATEIRRIRQMACKGDFTDC